MAKIPEPMNTIVAAIDEHHAAQPTSHAYISAHRR